MRILAIDPGTEQSGWVSLEREPHHPNYCIVERGIDKNEDLKELLVVSCAQHLAIEMIASYGMPVGKSTFETCVWIGRFIEAAQVPYTKCFRKDIKIHLCGSMKAKDGNIRRALLDRYPKTGGGANPEIGTKGKKGPLYGFSSHMWSALAVGHYWLDVHQEVVI